MFIVGCWPGGVPAGGKRFGAPEKLMKVNSLALRWANGIFHSQPLQFDSIHAVHLDRTGPIRTPMDNE